eukprot:366557-Chlamydomonas_euryale.AAC.6
MREAEAAVMYGEDATKQAAQVWTCRNCLGCVHAIEHGMLMSTVCIRHAVSGRLLAHFHTSTHPYACCGIMPCPLQDDAMEGGAPLERHRDAAGPDHPSSPASKRTAQATPDAVFTDVPLDVPPDTPPLTA